MKFIELKSTDPRFNLALEETLFDSIEEDYFILWQNEPTVVVGRFQNTLEEIDSNLARSKGIHIVRRISGGGAVYHDLGNLNFSFVVKVEDTHKLDYRKMIEPVAKTLQAFGVKTCFNSRNDLVVDGLKFSGNAQYARKGRLLHHGTILFDSDLDMLGRILCADPDKYQSKGVKSVRSRVTNVRPFIRKGVSLKEFCGVLYRSTAMRWPQLQRADLNETICARASTLAKDKYATWEWNYGISPDFDVQRWGRFDFGKVDIRFRVQKGRVVDCRIFGDFFGNGNIRTLERSLIGAVFSKSDLAERIDHVHVGHFVHGMDKEVFKNLIFE